MRPENRPDDFLIDKQEMKKYEERFKLWHNQNFCNVCLGRDVSVPDRPDVYFREPYFDPFISDPDVPGHEWGSYVTSKRHKAILMKKLGLREASDQRHGTDRFDPIMHRHALESLRRNS